MVRFHIAKHLAHRYRAFFGVYVQQPGSATLQGGWRRRGRFMVWRSRRVGAKVRVTASVKLLPVPSARIPCFINVHQHNKRCREVGFWVFAERRCWSRVLISAFSEQSVPGRGGSAAGARSCRGRLQVVRRGPWADSLRGCGVAAAASPGASWIRGVELLAGTKRAARVVVPARD